MSRALLTCKFPAFLFHPTSWTRAKLCTLLFDQILVPVFGEPELPFVLEWMCKHGELSKPAENGLKHAWKPVERVSDKELFADEWIDANLQLWETCGDVVDRQLALEYRGYSHEEIRVIGGSASVFANTLEGVVLWSRLQELAPCVLAGDRIQVATVRALQTQQRDVSQTGMLRELANLRLPNFGALPWDSVVKLRKHRHMEAFRSKLEEIVQDGLQPNSTNMLTSLRKQELDGLWKLARKWSVSHSNTILRTIASNVPLPIPVNPVSVALGVAEILSTRRIQHDYGWLFFLADIDDSGVRPDLDCDAIRRVMGLA